MNWTRDVLTEVFRLQTLVCIDRPSGDHRDPATVGDLCKWFRIPLAECVVLLHELVDEGFIEPLPSGPIGAEVPLHLSTAGVGLLRWFNDQVRRPRTRAHLLMSA